jgi:hypothetical protein
MDYCLSQAFLSSGMTICFRPIRPESRLPSRAGREWEETTLVPRFWAQLFATAAMLTLSGVTYAADMAVKAPPPTAPAANWTGFYVGVQVEGAGFDPSCTTTAASPNTVVAEDPAISRSPAAVLPCGSSRSTGGIAVPDPTSSFSSTSFMGGAKIGYDWKFWSHAIVGVVGDSDWTHLNSTATSTLTDGTVVATGNETINWLASARGKPPELSALSRAGHCQIPVAIQLAPYFIATCY